MEATIVSYRGYIGIIGYYIGKKAILRCTHLGALYSLAQTPQNTTDNAFKNDPTGRLSSFRTQQNSEKAPEAQLRQGGVSQ